MATSLAIGSFFNSGGRTILSGIGGSGFDTEKLLEGLMAARQIPITQLEDKIKVNDKITTAYSELRSLVDIFRNASDSLRKVPGFGKEASNGFDYATADVVSNTAISGSSYMSVSASPGATSRSYTIDSITSIAKAARQSSQTFSVSTANTAIVFDTPASGQFRSGTFEVNGEEITLVEDDTLNSIAAKFNAVSDETNITASVVKLADSSFKLLFSATETGEDFNFDLSDPGTVSDPDNVFNDVTFDAAVDGENAEFSLDGQTIIRSSNNISDVIDGLTFNLVQATPLPDTTDLTVNIRPDTATAKSAIIDFANAYNNLKVFIAEQSERDADGNLLEDAVLGNESLLRSMITQVSSELTRAVSGISSGLSRLSEIGLTFTNLPESEETPAVSNILTLDEGDLDAALASNYDEVRKVFEFSFTSSNPALAVSTRTNALSITSFTLDIDPNTDTYEATYTDSEGTHTIELDATELSGGTGYTLTGQTGTVLEGLTLLYASTNAASNISVSLSQGIADRLFNLTETFMDDQDGLIEMREDAIASANERLEAEIERLNDRLDAYREQLIFKLQNLERVISLSTSTLNMLDAQAAARENR